MVAAALSVQHEANAEVDISDLTPRGVVLRCDETGNDRLVVIIDITFFEEIKFFKDK